MILLTNDEMRKADAYTIETVGVPSLTLMERAGEGLFLKAKSMTKGATLVVCGGGNNGGDGFVCARKLREDGLPVSVLFLGDKCTKECRANYDRYLEGGGLVVTEFPEGEYSLVVDCLFGTGFRPRGGEAEIIARINAYKNQGAKLLSADVPSGLCDDGSAPFGAVLADATVCFGFKKLSTAIGDGLDVCGEVSCVDIGICLPEGEYVRLATDEAVKGALPKRKRNSHKGTFGRAAIVGGSEQYTGAAYLALSACVRGGAGYSTLYTDETILPAFYLKVPEALLVGCKAEFVEADYTSLLSYDAVGFGVGATMGEKTKDILRFLLKNYEGKLVVDADGLNALSALPCEERAALFRSKKCSVVMTPHKKEFSRLTQKSMEEINKNALDISKAYAKENGVVLLLKGASTIVTDGEKATLCTSGNSGQAKGGSGDVLTGFLTSLLASGCTPFEGAFAASYLVGKGAEIARETTGEMAMTASDVIGRLVEAVVAVQR